MDHSRWTLGCLLLLVGACGDDDESFSDSHDIGHLNASYGAFADEGSLKVYAALLGPKGFVRLRGGDAIEVDINGQRTSTNERLLDDKVHYIAEIAPPPGETEVVIAFLRGKERVVGKIRLFSAFTLKTPPASVKKGGNVEIDIDPRPDLSKWPGFFGPGLVARAEVVGECLEPSSQSIELCAVASEPGKCTQGYPLRLDAGKLALRPSTKGCELTVQARLTSSASPFEGTGPAKTSFKGGGFEGYRLRTFKMQLAE